MMKSILILFLFAVPVFSQHLAEQVSFMNNLTVKQSALSWGGGRPETKSETILSIYHGVQTVTENEIRGIQPYALWYGILWRVQFYSLKQTGINEYAYQSLCPWRYNGKSWLVPCTGSLKTDKDLHVLSLSEVLEVNSTPVIRVTQDINYDWVEVRGIKRLLPVNAGIIAEYTYDRFYASAEWKDYREYHAEVVVKDVDDEQTQTPVDTGRIPPRVAEAPSAGDDRTTVESAVGQAASVPIQSFLTPEVKVTTKTKRDWFRWIPKIRVKL